MESIGSGGLVHRLTGCSQHFESYLMNDICVISRLIIINDPVGNEL